MQSLGQTIFRRFLRALLTLWLVVSVVFVILHLSGDPVITLLGPDAQPAQVDALRHELGLDLPLPVQYARYFVALARGDFGLSLHQRQPSLRLVLERFPATLQLATAAFALSIAIGLVVGLLAALLQRSFWDRLSMSIISFLQAGPTFFIGILLILFFSVHLGWFPSSGRGTVKQLVLPAVTLAIATTANISRLTRSTLLDVLGADYIRTARAKGLHQRQVVLGHALKNAALPLVTFLGIEIGGLLTGAVITETVFAWPGLGRLAVDAVSTRDYPVVQASVLFIAAVFIGINFLIDCSYTLLDPRVRGI